MFASTYRPGVSLYHDFIDMSGYADICDEFSALSAESGAGSRIAACRRYCGRHRTWRFEA